MGRVGIARGTGSFAAAMACMMVVSVTAAQRLASPPPPLAAPSVTPSEDFEYWPSRARTVGNVDVATWADVALCANCHQQEVAEWRGSAHAHASFDNPWYAASVAEFRRSQGNTASRFCAGCHDPLLLFSEQIDGPESTFDPLLATTGVSCLVCHSTTASDSFGNASYVLRTDPVPMPRPDDAASLQAHRDRLRASDLGSPTMCGSCHRGVLSKSTGNGHTLVGIDDLGAWRSSAYAGSQTAFPEGDVGPKACIQCHMVPVFSRRGAGEPFDSTKRSHRFAGGQTSLAHARNDEAQLVASRTMLQAAAAIDVPALRERTTGALRLPGDNLAGREWIAQVVVFNDSTGHRFPGGVLDTQDTHITVEVHDERGKRIAWTRANQAPRLQSVMIDRDGRVEKRHRVDRFAARLRNKTVAARGVELFEFAFTLPSASVGRPFWVQAKLVHRRHSKAFHRFVRSSKLRFAKRPPATQPTTRVAEARVRFGGGQPKPSFGRLARLARASLVRRQEDLARGEDVLGHLSPMSTLSLQQERYLRLAYDARLGRAAMRGEAREPVPALLLQRALGWSRIFQSARAYGAIRAVAAAAPADARAQSLAATLAYAANAEDAAARFAHAALALQPWDEVSWRILARIGSPQQRARAAASYERFRNVDGQHRAKLRCYQRDHRCSQDEQPIPRIVLMHARGS